MNMSIKDTKINFLALLQKQKKNTSNPNYVVEIFMKII